MALPVKHFYSLFGLQFPSGSTVLGLQRRVGPWKVSARSDLDRRLCVPRLGWWSRAMRQDHRSAGPHRPCLRSPGAVLTETRERKETRRHKNPRVSTSLPIESTRDPTSSAATARVVNWVSGQRVRTISPGSRRTHVRPTPAERVPAAPIIMTVGTSRLITTHMDGRGHVHVVPNKN